MIRITFLIRSLEVGGAERQLVELVRHLNPHRFQTSVVTFYSGGDLSHELTQLASVRHLSLEKRGRWNVVGFLWRLCQVSLSLRPHIMHGYLGGANECAWLAGRLAGAKVVWGLRASNVDFSRYTGLPRLVFRVGAWLSGLTDLIIVNSEAGRRHHVRHGYRGQRVIVIPNGIDVARFQPLAQAREQLRAEWQIPDELLVVGMVGRLDPMKDHPTFLRAAAQLARERAEVRFVCVGEGPPAYKAELTELARSLGLQQLIWSGARLDIESVYNAFDVLVSSSAYGEGFPNVVGEAMACGVPCIVTDVGDAAHIVSETGYVAPPHDPAALARALSQMLALTPGERQALGTAARARIEKSFNISQLAARTEAALLALVQPHV
jgi:glycosyltransferase involved in cell wall biosynthesis